MRNVPIEISTITLGLFQQLKSSASASPTRRPTPSTGGKIVFPPQELEVVSK
jgi:hypothetical protein